MVRKWREEGVNVDELYSALPTISTMITRLKKVHLVVSIGVSCGVGLRMIPMLLRVRNGLLTETDVNVHVRGRILKLIVAYGLKVTTHNVKTLWIEGKLNYLPGQDKLCYEACEKCLCFRVLDVQTEWKIWCSNCQIRTNRIVCVIVNKFLSHETTIIEATIKAPDTNKLIPYIQLTPCRC